MSFWMQLVSLFIFFFLLRQTDSWSMSGHYYIAMLHTHTRRHTHAQTGETISLSQAAWSQYLSEGWPATQVLCGLREEQIL